MNEKELWRIAAIDVKEQCEKSFGRMQPIISNKKKLTEEELKRFDEILDRMDKIYSGQYRELFEEVELLLGRKATLYDYHELYVECINKVTFILCQNIDLAAKGILEKTSYAQEMTRYKNLRKALDAVFVEFAGKNPNPEMQKVLEELKRLERQNEQQYETLRKEIKANEMAEWKEHLIDKGFLYPDGKRVVSNLDLTIAELVNYIAQNVTSQFIQENFLKPNGDKYSKKSCNQARDYANKK